jgi:hypothetical protein
MSYIAGENLNCLIRKTGTVLCFEKAAVNNGQQVTVNTTALYKSAGYKLLLTYLNPYKDRCMLSICLSIRKIRKKLILA